MISDQYPYLYETHLHTNRGSKCGNSTPREMVEANIAAGYAGMFVTDHNWGGNCGIERSAYHWGDYIRAFASGYEEAREYGASVGFSVFWGYEAGFGNGLGCPGTEVLVYGVTPQWLMDHPEIETMPLPEHCALVRSAGGLIVHAHPFREREYIPEIRLFPRDVCAVEAVNAGHSRPETKENVPEFDRRAIAYAKEHHFPVTAGSDIHCHGDIRGAGVAFAAPLENDLDYCRRILSHSDYVVTNGYLVFDNRGNLLPDKPTWK